MKGLGLRSEAPAGAAAAEMLQDRQEGGGRLQKVFRSPLSTLFQKAPEGVFRKDHRSWLGPYREKDLIYAFQDKTVCQGDGDPAAKEPTPSVHPQARTHTLTHSKPGHGHCCLGDNFKQP